MKHTDFQISLVKDRLVELSMKNGTPKKYAGYMFEAAEIIAQLLKERDAALLAQQEAEKNEPLTLEELQKMNEHPVWWWNGRSKPVCTICSFLKPDEEPFFTNYDFEEKDCTAITPYRYFKKFGYKPYRRPPEGKVHE